MSITIEWNGDEVKKRADKLAGKSSFEIGLIVEGQAKLLSPYKTGRLRGSIQTVSGLGQETSPDNSADKISRPTDKYETHVGTAVNYAPYMEFGTIHTNAQPYLRPALDMAKGKAPVIVKTTAKNEFGEYLYPEGTQ